MRRPARSPSPHLPFAAPVLVLPLVLALAFAPPAAGPAHGQEAAELPHLVDEISIEVVNVDVVVTDRKGRPIAGLTPADFVLYEDGERREISNFYAFNDGRARRVETAPEGAGGEAAGEGSVDWGEDRSLRRRMALLFDGNSLDKRDRQRAIEGLERFVLEQFDGTYEWAVIAYSDRLQHMQPFTSDKTTVLAALARVGELPIPVRQARATDSTLSEQQVVVSRTEALFQRQAIDQAGPRHLTASEFEMRERMLDGLRQFDRTIAAAVQTMRAYAGMPGRKSLVLITGALETLPGGAQVLGAGFPGVGEDGSKDPMVTVLHSEYQRRFGLVVQTANAAGFAIYPIASDIQNTLMRSKAPYLDVARETRLGFSSFNGGGIPEVESETASRVMAEGTGGEFYSTTRFFSALDDIDDRTGNSYVLGFTTDHAPDRRYHRIRVELRNGLRGKIQVDHREGYLHLSREERLLEELSTPLAFPKERGDFPIAMEVSEPSPSGKKTVALTVAGVIPIRDVTLVPLGEEMVGRVHLYLAVYDHAGELVRLFREQHDVRLPADKLAAAGEGAPARFGLTVPDLERGDYTLTLTLMDEITDRFGTGLAPVEL